MQKHENFVPLVKKGVLFDLFLSGPLIHVQRAAKLRDLGIEGDRRLAKPRAVKKLPCGGQCTVCVSSAVSDTGRRNVYAQNLEEKMFQA